LGHHGIIAGVIDDLNMVPLLDKHLPQGDEQEITSGEAVKGIIINGLGFPNHHLSLSSQFLPTLR
jgi:transposase